MGRPLINFNALEVFVLESGAWDRQTDEMQRIMRLTENRVA